MENKAEISQEELNIIIMFVIHETKNALFQSQEILAQLQDRTAEDIPEIDLVQREIQGMNQSLMRLLSLYKMNTNTFSLYREQNNIYEFFEELVITNTSIQANNDVNIEIDCDEYLEWYFDLELVNNVINSIINNTIRYAKSQIVLSAEIEDKILKIHIMDDGSGFPEQMLSRMAQLKTKIDFNLQNSGLGLYFAEKIANLHNQDGIHGYTTIENNPDGGGGCFTLCLP